MITSSGGFLENFGRYLYLVSCTKSKKPEFEAHFKCLENLIADQRVLIIGAIRQEVLSGYGDPNKFEQLNTKLGYFKNTPILDNDYITAAKYYNDCRKNGIQGSHIDLLIRAVAARLNVQIFTTDKDFGFYRQHPPIMLFFNSRGLTHYQSKRGIDVGM